MNLSGLRLVNVATKLTVKELVLANARMVPGQIDATIFDGVLSVAIADSRSYNGIGQGRLIVDVSQEIPAHSLRLSVTKVEALPLLIDVFAFPHLAGQMQAHAVFQSKGDSPAAIVAALDGTAKVLIENGTVEGLENMIGAMPMNIWQAWSGSSEKTAFGTFGATFSVANGQAATEDLILDGPHVRASGKGSINFASKSVDFTVEPTVVVGKSGAQPREQCDQARRAGDDPRPMEQPAGRRATGEHQSGGGDQDNSGFDRRAVLLVSGQVGLAGFDDERHARDA